MIQKNGLRKLTKIESKINKLFLREQITPDDIETLSKKEYEHLAIVLSEKSNNLKGVERDKFYKKVDLITNDFIKNQVWENNHLQIMHAISTFIQESGYMPSKTQIAFKTELSRQTVHKHFKENKIHPEYIEQIEQFKFMTSKVLAKVFQFAVNGDMAAAKLYFNAIGFMNNGQTANSTLIKNQNNYIQINGTVLSQETIKHLNPEQLNTIETILKTALPQSEVLEVIS